MNDEPVAWMDDCGNVFEMKNQFFHIPLYTHPNEADLGIAEAIGFDKGYKAATAKTLTDDEIIDIADTYDWHKDCAIDFARAILKKASEK